MKRLLITVFSLNLIFFGVANAQNATAAKINAIKQEVNTLKQTATENRNEIKNQIASSTKEVKNLKQELRSAAEIRINKKLTDQKIKISDSFEKAIQNEKNLIERIDSRISKMQAENIDTASSSALLDLAKTKMVSAEIELKNFENILSENIPSATSTQLTTRKTLLENIRNESEKTKTLIKEIHSMIIDTISSLKKGLLEKNSTSTITNN